MRFFLSLLISFVSLPAFAQSDLCGISIQPVSVVVSMSEQPLRTNFTLNRQQMDIEGAKNLEKARNGMAETHVGGLAHGIISSSISIEFLHSSGVVKGQNVACAAAREVKVLIDYQPNIFISREFPQGSCYFNAVMEHEMKHVMTDRQVVREYAPRMKQALQQAASKVGVRGPVNQSQLPQLAQQIQGFFNAPLEQVWNAMNTERERRQSMVDTPQEYARVQALCQNWP